MPFKITWTSATGSEQIQVATAAEALHEYVTRNGTVTNMVVKDDHGRRVKPDELVSLIHMSERATDA